MVIEGGVHNIEIVWYYTQLVCAQYSDYMASCVASCRRWWSAIMGPCNDVSPSNDVVTGGQELAGAPHTTYCTTWWPAVGWSRHSRMPLSQGNTPGTAMQEHPVEMSPSHGLTWPRLWHILWVLFCKI